MFNSREYATAIIIMFTIVMALIPSRSRAHWMPLLRDVVRAALDGRLVWSYVLIITMGTLSTISAWRIGLWNPRLLKDAVLLTILVAIPFAFRAVSQKSGGELTRGVIRETLSLTALLEFYVNSAPLPLGWEITLQLTVIFLFLGKSAPTTKPDYAPLKRLFNILLLVIGLFLIAWTTVTLINSPTIWAEFFLSLSFNIWLPLSLLPFFYLFGYLATMEACVTRFHVINKPLAPRVIAAIVVGTRLRLSLLSRLDARYNCVGDSAGFRDGLERMSQVRADLAHRDQEESNRLQKLADNSGRSGVDNEGRHFDRREFDVTKERLNWIWVCENGQYERQGNRYWDDLTDLIVDPANHGLPDDHGFVVEITADEHAWRAWRRTPGGAVLGIGGLERGSQFYFQGDTPPDSWPTPDSDNWRDSTHDEWPPDWSYDDNSRK